jgi:hypothetical protein
MNAKNSWAVNRTRKNLPAAIAAAAITVLLMYGLDVLAVQYQASLSQVAGSSRTINA